MIDVIKGLNHNLHVSSTLKEVNARLNVNWRPMR